MRRKRYILLTIAIIFAAYCGLSLYSSSCMLSVSSYEIQSSKISEKIRIVQITDFHNSQFGDGNEKLTNLICEQEPDFIVITGDLLNSAEQSTGIAVGLVSDLHHVAPVYISKGNHETDFEEKQNLDLTAIFSEAGAVVLESDYVDMAVNDQFIRLGGIYGYCLPEANEAARVNETIFLENFQDTEIMKVLLTHMPLAWYHSGSLNIWDIDVVFAGHTHGGQIRLPFIGGLWAPDQGWFPGKEAGLYYSENQEKVMVLSRGLGSAEKIPRFNNIPEVVVVDIVPED